MKPEPQSQNEGGEPQPPVVGDVIGDTAYSERFVLKILLKLANLDTLKDEVLDKSFEEDLCTLWDMTSERDVVLFLLKHDVLNLLNFALPTIESPRIIEILIGITGNMCCYKEAVSSLLKFDTHLQFLIEYIKTDDSSVLIQVLRLISSCLYLANDNISIWMDLFKNVGYSTHLYFILKNSACKELLMTALENLNSLCSYCNIEAFRSNFYAHFVTTEALNSITTAFVELVTEQRDSLKRDERERIFVISLQITLNFVGFNNSAELYKSNNMDTTNMIEIILKYYEDKLLNEKEIDTDLIDVMDSTNAIVKALCLSEISNPEKYFAPSFSLWKALPLIINTEKNGNSSFEEDSKEELEEFTRKIKPLLSVLICEYVNKCSKNSLPKILEEIGSEYENILQFSRTTNCNVEQNRLATELE